MTYYMKIEAGEPVGTPMQRPTKIVHPTLEGVKIGTGQLDDQQLFDMAAIAPISDYYLSDFEQIEGYRFDADALKVVAVIEPIALDLAQSKTIKTIDQTYASSLLAAVGNPTEAECDTWPIKRECALAFQAGAASDAQQTSLTRYATARGQSVEDYVALVLVAVDAHEQAAAHFEGVKATAKTAITEAETTEEIETILANLDWSYSTGA